MTVGKIVAEKHLSTSDNCSDYSTLLPFLIEHEEPEWHVHGRVIGFNTDP